MNRNRGFALATAAVAAVLVLVPAPTAAQESGALIGLRQWTDSGGAYRTVWIAREGGAVRLLASGPDLIVPRRSGFWRVCLASGHGRGEVGLAEWDSLVAAPATADREKCAAAGDTTSSSDDEGGSCRSSERLEILFLGTDAVSLERHEESDCGAHSSGGTGVSLAALDDGATVHVARQFTPARRAALMAATLRAAQREFADLGTADTLAADPDADNPDGGPRFEVQREWGVERGAGRWQMVGNAYCSPYVGCGDGSRRFSIPAFTPPARLTGPAELTPSLRTIRAAWPRVTDAVSSPRHDLVVAVNGDSLLVFLPHEGQLGEPALRLPVSGRIVMTQWGLGRFVAKWTAELIPLLGAQ